MANEPVRTGTKNRSENDHGSTSETGAQPDRGLDPPERGVGSGGDGNDSRHQNAEGHQHPPEDPVSGPALCLIHFVLLPSFVHYGANAVADSSSR